MPNLCCRRESRYKIPMEDHSWPRGTLCPSSPRLDNVGNPSPGNPNDANLFFSIASALPWIASDFSEISQLNWIVSSFNLTSAAFIPFWAQMADVFGRNASLNAAVIFMLIGSALCTGAPTNAFPVLLLGRGFQGLAAAGLNVIVRTILADKVSLQENARNWAIFALVGGISYAIGPVIGGKSTLHFRLG